MSRIRLVLVVLTVGTALLSAVPVTADQGSPQIPALDQRISLDLRKAAPQDVFEALEKLMAIPPEDQAPGPPVHIRVEPGVNGQLTICLRNVTVRTMLQATCESLGCSLSWSQEGDGYLLVVSPDENAPAPEETKHDEPPSLDQTIDLNLKDAELASVLRTVGGLTQRKVVIDSKLEGRMVTLKVKEIPVRELLDRLCQQAECTWQETALGVLTFSPR